MKTIEMFDVLGKTTHHNKDANKMIERAGLKDFFQLEKLVKLSNFFPEDSDCHHTFSIDVDDVDFVWI